MTTQQFLVRYAEIKQEQKALEEELKVLQEAIVQIPEVTTKEGLSTDQGTFVMRYFPRWKYSDELTASEKKLKEKLKLAKKKEEIDGVAQKVSDGGRLVFTAHKEG